MLLFLRTSKIVRGDSRYSVGSYQQFTSSNGGKTVKTRRRDLQGLLRSFLDLKRKFLQIVADLNRTSGRSSDSGPPHSLYWSKCSTRHLPCVLLSSCVKVFQRGPMAVPRFALRTPGGCGSQRGLNRSGKLRCAAGQMRSACASLVVLESARQPFARQGEPNARLPPPLACGGNPWATYRPL